MPLGRVLERGFEPTVAADDDVAAGERVHERVPGVPHQRLAELRAHDHVEPAGVGERRDGLDAPDRRARQDLLDRERGQEADELVGLPPPLLVERAQPVVARPGARVARRRVADEDHPNAFLPAESASLIARG